MDGFRVALHFTSPKDLKPGWHQGEPINYDDDDEIDDNDNDDDDDDDDDDDGDSDGNDVFSSNFFFKGI